MFLQCPGLEFQVWSKRPDGKRPQPQDGGQAEGGDSYLGSAHIDLSPLAYGLSQISGWYNVADFGGQVQGQLKVTLFRTLQMLSVSNVCLCWLLPDYAEQLPSLHLVPCRSQ